MPRGDQTGPEGAGPMTGRGAGICAETRTPGLGRRCGLGMGRRRGFGAADPMNQADQIAALKTQMNRIQQQIESLGDDN